MIVYMCLMCTRSRNLQYCIPNKLQRICLFHTNDFLQDLESCNISFQTSFSVFFLTLHRALCFNFALYLPPYSQISKIQCKSLCASSPLCDIQLLWQYMCVALTVKTQLFYWLIIVRFTTTCFGPISGPSSGCVTT